MKTRSWCKPNANS